MTQRTRTSITIVALLMAASCHGTQPDPATVTEPEVTTMGDEQPNNSEPASDLAALPVRDGPQQQTSGSVPHVQIDAALDQAIIDDLFERAFKLPDIEDRPTVVSLPGARGMWLQDSVDLAHPEVIVSGREFAHIHPDGSLHAPLPFDRAVEASEAGWAERHPWADDRDNWDGFVMLYTPRTADELTVTMQLIVESYNHVTGRDLDPSDY